ncbi:hypothetical protein ACUNDV_24855 [Serratia sp. IR-2025]
MMVNMLVNIWLYLTKAVITGDVDEVRVQSEEPYLEKPAQGNPSGLFAFGFPGNGGDATGYPRIATQP